MEEIPDKFGFVLLSISRAEIESFDHVGPLDALLSMKNDAIRFEGKLNICVSGYDQDPREIYEISEIKNYFDFLDRCFPYWFFFFTKTLPIGLSPFTTLISLLVPVKSVLKSDSKSRHLQFDEVALKQFIDVHFYYLNELTDEIGMSLVENERISNEIIANLF